MSASAATRLPPRNPIVLIPARMASTRLPGKPLADIGGRPMIVRVLERAEAAQSAPWSSPAPSPPLRRRSRAPAGARC